MQTFSRIYLKMRKEGYFQGMAMTNDKFIFLGNEASISLSCLLNSGNNIDFNQQKSGQTILFV
jgi:hypothetical protein